VNIWKFIPNTINDSFTISKDFSYKIEYEDKKRTARIFEPFFIKIKKF